MIPRIRTVKPEFFTHEGLYDAERETGLPIRIAFAGLWCCADREGRFQWRPRLLKLHILPHDDLDFSRVLDALTTRGWLVRYASQGQEFGWIPTFRRHQVINNRERDSELPNPKECQQVTDACPTRADAWSESESGREGKGRERNGSMGPNGPVDASASTPAVSRVNGEEVKAVLRALNNRTGSSFRYRNPAGKPTAHAERISALFRKGYRIEHFTEVIERKATEWENDDKMRKHLTPETLFRVGNFEKYLDEAVG